MQYLHSAQPFSIAVELDNLMLGAAAMKGFLQRFDDDDNEDAGAKEAVSAADFCQRAVWDALDDRLATALDLARRGDIEVTAADVLKVCQWARAEPKNFADDTLDLVIVVTELFAKSEAAKAEVVKGVAAKPTKAKLSGAATASRPKRLKATVARRKPKDRVRAKAA